MKRNPIIFLLSFLILYSSVNVICFGNNVVNLDDKQLISLSTPNTIYELSSVIDLHGQTVQIASGCCLHFKGGSFTNGILIGNDTHIVASCSKIFSPSLLLRGTFYSDVIRMSWWGTRGGNDNTIEVQCALNSILNFSNRIFEFDIPVRITDVSFVLKWSPGVKFISSCNSNQGSLSITVFGQGSQGLDISGTENLRFENILFRGDPNDPPKVLLYASRVKENKQCPGHRFVDVSFIGPASKSLIYNYAGESWLMDHCLFKADKNILCTALYYGTTSNSLNINSKFGNTETDITPLTYTNFVNCSFVNYSQFASIIFDGGINSNGKLKNIASICFDKCYFYTPKSNTAIFNNVYGSISIHNSVDESGADSKADGSYAFYKFIGNHSLKALSFQNNSFYVRENSPIIDVAVPLFNYHSKANYVVNYGGVWLFSELYDSTHNDLSSSEFFKVKYKSNNVVVEGHSKNIKIK